MATHPRPMTACAVLAVGLATLACASDVCEEADDAACGCSSLPDSVWTACQLQPEDDHHCEGADEVISQCVVDYEDAYCDYMADLVDDPAATLAEDYENAYLENCQ